MNANALQQIRRAVITATLAATTTMSLAFTSALPAGAGPVHEVTVTNHADDGSATSLRGVVDTINAEGGTWQVTLEPGEPYVINRFCHSGNLDDNHGGDLDLNPTDAVSIRAEWGTQATIQVACTGERAIHNSTGEELELLNIRITGGNTAKGANGIQNGDRDGKPGQAGGAIMAGGLVRLINVELDGNSTGAGGNGAPPLFAGSGGIGGDGGAGAAVYALGVFATASYIHDNVAGNGGTGGNGVGNNGDGGAGGDGGFGAVVALSAKLYSSEVTDNTSGNGGHAGHGLGNGGDGGRGGNGGDGAGVAAFSLETEGALIAFNMTGGAGDGGDSATAVGGDGGDGGSGAGVSVTSAAIDTTTIHGNATGRPGAPGTGAPDGNQGSRGSGGGIHATVASDILFSTITGNGALTGLNIDAPVGTTFRASVEGEVAGGPACTNPLNDESYSVHDSPSCNGGPGGSVVGSLGLEPLADNGGLTRSRLPMHDGELFALIPDDVCPNISTNLVDQRNQPRPNYRCEPGAVELPIGSASVFVPLPPTRVFDTREPGPASGYVGGGTTRSVTFGGVAGIPATGVTAVAFNLTIDDAAGDEFVTAWPSGLPQPLASSLNTVRPGQTVPNLVIVPLGAEGKIDFFAQKGGHLIADVVGYYSPAPVAAAGRTISIEPARLFDTREPGPNTGKIAAGGTRSFDVTGIAGVPESGVAAVVINLTATEADAAGFVTSYPGGTPRPLASTLNLEGPGHTAANLTIVPVGADGTVSFFSQSGTHLLADVTAYITDASAAIDSAGLFVPWAPTRVFDTRVSGAPVPAAGTIDVVTAGPDFLPSGAAVVLNLTATEAAGAGYITGWATGEDQPLASNLNLTQVGETRANAAILPTSSDNSISYFSQSGTHLLADVSGYFLPPTPLFAFVI